MPMTSHVTGGNNSCPGEPRQPITIFLVVPDQERREALAGLLAPLGERLIGFERAYSFLNTVDEASHGVVLMDLALPDIHSLVVIEALKVNEIKLPIIVVSDDARSNDACASINAGAVEVIVRDASPGIIADVVHRQLTRIIHKGCRAA